MSVHVSRHRFSVEAYSRMAECGILPRDARVELLDGEIVEMAPIGHRHAACVDWLTQALATGVSGRAIVRVQNPVRLGSRSEPQPDLALLRFRPDFYRSGHPGPAEVMLVVEVGDDSVDFDREVKPPLYAAAGIPEFWIVDLLAEHIDVYQGAGPQGYAQVTRGLRGDRISPASLPDLVLEVSAVLG
jgi:Uma2 family endonuclease